MCGIVAYFGGAGNPLTRILTGMSAIIYRAPDSTGIGLFGDDREPIRMRKSLGSVVQLLDALRTDAVYVRPEAVITRLLSPHGGAPDLVNRQLALLHFEGFDAPVKGPRSAVPDFDALADPEDTVQARLVPGSPGKAFFEVAYRIRSRKDLSTLIQALITTYDLSPLVIHTLIRNALAETMTRRRPDDTVGAAEADVLATFDDLFEATRAGARVKQLRVRAAPGMPKPPSARKALWQNLVETVISIPADYNRDGVCGLFRLLDAALLSRMAGDPTLVETLDRVMDTMWLPSQRPQRVDWRTLYTVEKGLNVYGWAGAAALAYLQWEIFFPAAAGELRDHALMSEESMVPGQTDPLLLRFLATPVIAHGRWAMQSAVTIENAHPFPDAGLQRALALNGQFDSRVEARLRTFLETVAGYRLRSENSAEYAALLWGHFFDQLKGEQQRSDVVRQQVENDMTDIAIGSQSIDYHVVHRVRGRTAAELDRMAFIAAARQIVKDGGQIAVAGISLVSPRQLFVASHNRPVFVVRRLDNSDFMVVSDINAALGLFSQNLIETTINALDALDQRRRAAARHEEKGPAAEGGRTAQAAFHDARQRLLAPFAVEVHPLDGEEIIALVETVMEAGRVCRRVTITDFDGHPLPDVESFTTRLDPITVRKDVDTSFHETHLREVPERFRYILNVYSPEATGAGPALDLKTRVLRRRFGRRLEGLRRLVLVGTGSTFHMAAIARHFIMRFFSDLVVDVMRPGDIEDPRRHFQPAQDLIVLLSWSSTTAEMVQLAQQLSGERILMAGITEKCFADMALAAEKSAGVMPIYSGEEVTIAGIKSTLCLLLCLDVLGIWIAAQKGLRGPLGPAFQRLQGLAERIAAINTNADAQEFAKQTAAVMTGADAVVVVTAPEVSGIGKEVALKLEEASWYCVGQCHSYDDILRADPGQWPPGRFVIVHATQRTHVETAAAVVETVAAAGIPLAVVTCASRHQDRIAALSGGRCLVLPRQGDDSQAYIDVAFYYRLALEFGLACGHGRGEAPRNRTKSPTVTRSRPRISRSPAAEIKRLEDALAVESDEDPLPVPAVPSKWETAFVHPETVQALAHLRQLTHEWGPAGSRATWAEGDAAAVGRLGRLLFDRRSEVNGVIVVSRDPFARAAVRDVAAFWRRLIAVSIRELPVGEWPANVADDVLVMAVAARSDDAAASSRPPAGIAGPLIAWVGPAAPDWLAAEKRVVGPFILASANPGDPAAQVYSGLHALFLMAWKDYQPQKAAAIRRHVAGAAQVVDQLLNDEALLERMRAVASANARYRSGFLISPAATAGRTWEAHFDRGGCLTMVHHPPGHAGHGPIVTIDGAADQKYVALETRADMLRRYGSPTIQHWEATYLEGKRVDAFLADPPGGPLLYPRAPFYRQNRWYLPVLKPGYDTRRDNLIILDMTSERALPQMLDELSLLGSRIPKLVIITQEARIREMGPKTLFAFPVGDLLVLPSSRERPIADLHLPLALNAVGAALAAAWKGAASLNQDA